MAKTKRTRIMRKSTLRKKKIRGGQVMSPQISNKINELLMLLIKKMKQDQNNKKFYTSCFESILKDVHNHKRGNGEIRGGRNLKSSLTKLLILIMTMKTGLSSQMVVHDSHLLEFKKELQDTRDIHDIGVVPGYENYYIYSEPENVMRFKITNQIRLAVDSLNKHYTTMLSGKGSDLSSASKITNMCRDVFLGEDVQKILLAPKVEPGTIYTLYTTPTPVPKETENLTDINFDTLCEISFPIPRLFIDDRDQTLKVEVTKSISYKKIADMLESLYKGVNSDKLDHEVNIKIGKLKYLIKGIRYIEDSSREVTDFASKVHNVHKRITDYFYTFEEIENMFGDPELHFQSVRKGLQNAFETRLMDQETLQNEIKARSQMNSYVLPFFSGVASVTDTSIEYFTNTVNSIITGFNIDKHLYNLIFIAMGTIVSCVAVGTCVYKKKNGTCVANESDVVENLKNEILRLKNENQYRDEYYNDRQHQHMMRIQTQPQQQQPQRILDVTYENNDITDEEQRYRDEYKHIVSSRQERQLQPQTHFDNIDYDINDDEPDNHEYKPTSTGKIRRQKCPKGTRRNKRTGLCEEYTPGSGKNK